MSEQLDRLVGALAGRYDIHRELGSGGMATVYLAEDVKHHREVAVKVLRADLSAVLGAERFLREIEIAAGLSHPHILPLYDSGDADGCLYYVMPYIKGESLRDKINRESQLAIDDAVTIVKAVAGALHYAHSAGLIHRDIKPENILLHEGEAMVADFGIALAVSQAAGERLTETGLSLGTPSYMSPEQATGDRQLTATVDVYALGSVLYELLAGDPPFTGTNVQSVIARIVGERATRIGLIRDTVPPHIEAALERALAKVPADRFATAAAFAEALSDAGGDTAGVRTDASARSIAVLPFDNMSADPEAEYFADGMTEEIINALTKIDDLQVASRTSAFAFKGKSVNIRRIGSELNVGTVLEGSVRKAGNKIRITAQLINVGDGYHLWSDRYDREMTDIFAVQDEIARAIVDTLKVKLVGAAEGPLVKPHTDNVEAYSLYLKGRYFWNKRNEEDLKRGIEHFEQAIALDAEYVLAHVGIADSYNILGFYDLLPPREAFPKAKAAALKALELDDHLAEAHTSLGYVKFYYDWDFRDAELTFKRAIELNPSYPVAHQFYANLLDQVGRPDEAEVQWRRAEELDPLTLIINAGLGWHYFFDRKYDQAILQLQRALQMDDTFVPGHFWIGLAYQQSGMHEQSVAAMTKARECSGGSPATVAELARAYALAGDADRAKALLKDLDEMAEHRYVPPYELAGAYLALDMTERVYALLNRAYDERSHSLAFLKADPRFDGLRTDEPFQALLRKVGGE